MDPIEDTRRAMSKTLGAKAQEPGFWGRDVTGGGLLNGLKFAGGYAGDQLNRNLVQPGQVIAGTAVNPLLRALGF